MNRFGFGAMRLPLINPDDKQSIDMDELKRMVDIYMEAGFTYFDTAFPYHDQMSETALKEALVDRYDRDKYVFADKMPTVLIKSGEEYPLYFNKQLEKTGVGYFDYYLMHNMGRDRYYNTDKCGGFEFAKKMKAEGKIKNFGFSFHDDAQFLDMILTNHPEVDFVQLQINYLDWNSEGIQSRKCYEVAKKHNKPVIVMEPVKGGTLAKVPDNVEKMFKDYNSEASIPSWAIRFAASHKNVKMVLSGMSNMEQLMDNMSYMKDFKPLNNEEQDIIMKAVDAINSNIAIPCTGCSYCTEGCPMKIAIPKYFSLYNADLQEVKEKGWTPQGEYYDRLTHIFGKASDCVACGQCEKACPQHLSIIEDLKKVAEYFGK